MSDSNTFGCGKYYFFRDHDSDNGWGVKLTGSDNIIASVADKNYAALIAELLNKYGSQYDWLNFIEQEILRKD